METLLRRLSRAGLRRGLGGEGWAWLLLAASAFTLRRAMRESPATVAVLRVRPGDRFEIAAVERRRKRRYSRTVEPSEWRRVAVVQHEGTPS
jgi:hypothetical protein